MIDAILTSTASKSMTMAAIISAVLIILGFALLILSNGLIEAKNTIDDQKQTIKKLQIGKYTQTLYEKETLAKNEEAIRKLEYIRYMVNANIDGFRTPIKNKLTSLGSTTISSLSPEKYNEYIEFLETLEYLKPKE